MTATLLQRAQALVDEAKNAPLSSLMAEQLWAMKRELIKADLTVTPEGYALNNALHEQWMRHNY